MKTIRCEKCKRPKKLKCQRPGCGHSWWPKDSTKETRICPLCKSAGWDIKGWESWDIDWKSVDFLIAGFPCQAWSVAGKQGGDIDPRGALVHDLIAIWEKLQSVNPNLTFLFENVRMKKEFVEYINNLFGVEPILIDSALVSAQTRKRFYWTNIPNVTQPEDRGILLKDIVHETLNEVIDIPAFNVNPSGRGMNGDVISVFKYKSRTITTNKGEGSKIAIPLSEYIVPFETTLKILDKEVARGKIGYFRKDSQANRVYYIHGKAVTLCGDAGVELRKWVNIFLGI